MKRTESTDYRARLYASYATTQAGLSDRRTAARTLEREIAEFLPSRRDARIVDLGCGQGDHVDALHRLGYTAAEGIDVSPEQVELAREAGIEGVHVSDLESFLAVNVGALDVVMATDVLEHFDKPEVLRVLDLVAASLRPGGLLIARVPNAESPYGGRYRYGDFTHGLAYTAASVRQIARAAGFSDVTIRPCEPVPHGFLSATRLVLWKLISAVLKAPLVVESGEVRGHIVTQNLMFVARKP